MTAPDQTLGSYVSQLLAARGVDTVFGIPGVHTVELYRGLDAAGITHITPRHEQGAGFMADGYARVSGKPGVCFIISGPGMTNILTAMGQAYGCSIPMLVISAVNAQGRMGSGEGWLHELPDQRGLVAGCAAFSRTIHTADELEKAIDDAFSVFEGQRPRPVHIEIPVNLLTQIMPHETAPKPKGQIFRPAPSQESISAMATLLKESKRPVILAGGGSLRADIRPLAERLDAPVVMTTNGRGILPPDHPLGVSVSASMPHTRRLIADADCVLAIGTELGPTDYDFYENGGFAIAGTLIRVDIDARQASRFIAADLTVIADAAATSAALLAELPAAASPRTQKDSGATRAASARRDIDELSVNYNNYINILEDIRDSLPESYMVSCSTQLSYAGNIGFAASHPGSYFNSATGFGTLGYGLPAAIGASIAAGAPVICITGDGGLQFTLGELASAREIDAPVIMILHDNKGYGEIKSYMKTHDIPTIGVDIYTPDLMAVARACGWHVLTPDRQGLVDAIKEAALTGGPVMIYLDDDVMDVAISLAAK